MLRIRQWVSDTEYKIPSAARPSLNTERFYDDLRFPLFWGMSMEAEQSAMVVRVPE